MSNIVIKVENLSKEYRLGVIGHGTLASDMQSWWARFRGKPDPNAPIINDARKKGDHFMAIRDISFEVKAGERLGIIGKNGAGKSTLLKLLSRITTPSSGSMRLKGRVASLLEVGTGFHPELTGRENIFLNGAILGMNKVEIKTKMDEIIDFAGVEDYIDTPVKRYSSGMHVRLGFAVAAHLEPDIMIVDEVLAVGDAEFQKKCIGKMEDVSNNQGRTILFVSHNMPMVKKLCNRGILLEDGKCVYEGSMGQVSDRYLGGSEVHGHERVSELIYTKDLAKPMQIMKINLLNNIGESSNTFSFRDEITLFVEYEVRQEIDGLGIEYRLLRGGEPVLSHCDTDQLSDSIVLREPGRYQTRVKLPSFLTPGLYQMESIYTQRLLKTNKNHSAVLDVVEMPLSFEIKKPTTEDGYKTWLYDNCGPVYTNELWETTRI